MCLRTASTLSSVRLDRFYVFCLKAFRALRDIELYSLAVLHAAEAARLNRREMHENVFAAQLSFFCPVASVSDCIPLRIVSAVSNLAQTCSRTPVSIEAARTEELHMLGTILIVILVLALVGALPRWSHSKNWGYFPTGGVGLVLLVVVFLLALGRI